MLVVFGLCLLLRSLVAEGCSANQHSTATVVAAEGEERLPENVSSWLPYNATCQWNITAPVGKVVKIRLLAIFRGSCNDEYLKVYDGADESSNVLLQYCNSTSTLVNFFISSGRSLFLEAKTAQPNATLMWVYYHAVDFQDCSINSTLDAPKSPTKSNFSSPYYPDGFPVNLTCGWFITAPENYTVKLTLASRLSSSPSSKDSVKVYDVDGSELTVASLDLNTLYSKSRSLYVLFKSDNKPQVHSLERGIFVSYTAMKMDCSINSTLDAPVSPAKSNFSSPDYPNGFPMNLTCGWFIASPENHFVKLTLTSRLSFSSSSKDSVEVYDVDGSELTDISLNLNYNKATDTVYSKFRSLYVVFKSDDKPRTALWAEEGIFVSYTAIEIVPSCSSSNSEEQNMNIILRDPSGAIKTPGYPSNYPTDLITQCFWKIIAPKGQVIRLDFSSFRMGKYHCVYIKDGINQKAPLEMFDCGSKTSFSVYSTGRELTLNIKKLLSSTPGPGFIANYSTAPAGLSSGTCIPKENSTVHMSGEGGSFSTPGYPLFPGIGTCSWNITVTPGKFVKLTFWTFKGLCESNYVEVFDVTNSTRNILTERFCDEKVVFSKGNNVQIKYSILKSIYQGGFIASYEALDSVPARYSCSSGGYKSDLTGTTGELASFNYPLLYPNDASCSWTLEVPAGNLIQFTFHSFNLQPSKDCQADYVEVKQGRYKHNSQVIGRFCGSSLPLSFQSNYSKVFVHFVTDSSGRYPGFHASFRAFPNPAMGPCKVQGVDNVIPLSGKVGRLFSPLYPQTYPPNMMCTWTITVPEGHFVKLRITSFFLEYTCKGSTLQIRDGQSESSSLLKSFCARKFESSVFSSGRHLWIRFQTPADKYLSGTGFSALFEAVNQLPSPFSCKADNRRFRLKSKSGNLASYNYPLAYDENVECVWVIYVDTDYNIELSFDFFNLSRSTDCAEDYVEVRDGQFDTSDLVGKFCGSGKPESITSDSWDLHVKFKSSGKKKYPGFKASYETKKTTAAILKIVGIVLGALSALCTLIGVCCKYRNCNSHDHSGRAVGQGSENDYHAEAAGADNVALKEQTSTL